MAHEEVVDGGATPDEVVEAVMSAVAEFSDGELGDDVALLAVRLAEKPDTAPTD